MQMSLVCLTLHIIPQRGVGGRYDNLIGASPSVFNWNIIYLFFASIVWSHLCVQSSQMELKSCISNEVTVLYGKLYKTFSPIIYVSNAEFVYYISEFLIVILFSHFRVEITHYNSYFSV